MTDSQTTWRPGAEAGGAGKDPGRGWWRGSVPERSLQHTVQMHPLEAQPGVAVPVTLIQRHAVPGAVGTGDVRHAPSCTGIQWTGTQRWQMGMLSGSWPGAWRGPSGAVPSLGVVCGWSSGRLCLLGVPMSPHSAAFSASLWPIFNATTLSPMPPIPLWAASP